MSLERRVNKLNRLLLSELGSSPAYLWVWSESPFFFRLSPQLDDSGQPIYNYRCACGLNRAVHSPDCQSLILPEPALERVKIYWWLENVWALCCLQPSPRDSREIPVPLSFFSHRLRRPETVSLPPNESPSESSTGEIIRMFRDHRSRSFTDLQNEVEARRARELQTAPPSPREQAYARAAWADGRVYRPSPQFYGRRFDDLRCKIREELGISSRPGAKNEVSFPSPKPQSIPEGGGGDAITPSP